ncbi:MAG: peptide-methionine (S)-S-oxide reductase MsrA, partial [Albidovulum sp.]
MLSALFGKPTPPATPQEALPGRPTPIPTAEKHFVFHRPLKAPLPGGMEEAMFGMGCFWGAERKFWELPGVWLTMVGYSAGFTPNPTYKETCTGLTGHSEVVRVIFDPKVIGYEDLLKVFWENHDPTQGNRQGNDVGSQYRSGIYTFGPDQAAAAERTRAAYAERLKAAGYGPVTTEILPAGPFFFAEDYHQQ